MDRRNRDRGKKRITSAGPTRAATPKIRDGMHVASGDYADVWLFGEARREYEALLTRTDETSRKSAVQLPRYFGRYAENQPLGDQMFKPLGRFKGASGNDVQIYEFKSWQFRIYGVVRLFRGKRCFLGIACDPSKKKNRADPAKMKKAAAEAEDIT
ncbi:hypothetical protein NKJ35_19205 [Mesorhizobium sp. M0136]|uniref:hypothetical protein n=1 Tax=Mesorhizobium sp. M0136 TaxID=2956890 RepID=UPI0033385502